MAHRWTKAERAAHNATLNALADARDQLQEGSVPWLYLGHCFRHCLEAWLSESCGYEVRITSVTDDGYEVTRVG